MHPLDFLAPSRFLRSVGKGVLFCWWMPTQGILCAQQMLYPENLDFTKRHEARHGDDIAHHSDKVSEHKYTRLCLENEISPAYRGCIHAD